MAQQLTLGNITAIDLEQEPLDWESFLKSEEPISLAIVQNSSDPISEKMNYPGMSAAVDDHSSGESRDIVDATLLGLPRPLHSQLNERRQSCSTVDDSPTPSRSSSLMPSLPSSTTTPSLYTVDSFTGFNATSARRPSVLSRLRLSISAASTSSNVSRRPTVLPSDFQTRPEEPEKRFVDAIGMILPGVSDRSRCVYPRAHFVSTFRLCEPIEYTTTLADHGITYTDYSRLLTALSNFLDEITFESKQKKCDAGFLESDNQGIGPGSKEVLGTTSSVPPKKTFFDTTEQLDKAKQHAAALNKLLEDITWNMQARGVPVMICVNSFSLFAPHRISEAHIQVLHVTLEQMLQSALASDDLSEGATTDAQAEERLSFVDLSSLVGFEERPPRPKLERQAVSATPTVTARRKDSRYQRQKAQPRDRSRPAPLWPNAIPSCKRQVMSENAVRYGQDPYFRAWMRANINSRTRSNTYAKYMIEQEDDPFVNKRLDYTEPVSRGTLIFDVLVNGTQAWKAHYPTTAVNREKYEHNRRLECRKTVEHGSRLRIVRFGFRYSIYPPHTPEMSALGLTKKAYLTIMSNIDAIHASTELGIKGPMSYLVASMNKIRKRSTEDALMKVSEYIRELNASQRRIVWTIEKVPGVYDRGLARDRTEWEISAWNGEDPLELVLQLEKWGIIEKRLDVEDED